jgi:predicted secreted hydrolase
MSDKTRRMFSRRRALTWLAGAFLTPDVLAQTTSPSPPGTRHPSTVTPFAPVVPGYQLQFPRDAGSHPEFRIEWWYVTGWLQAEGQPLGFQVTFFRARPELRHENPSTFAPRQVMVAHAALSDPRHGQLISAQRAARAVFELAGAALGDTRVWIKDWRLERHEAGYRAAIADNTLQIELSLTPSQPPLLQGMRGFSRKGPAPESASYYYSEPHLRVSGTASHSGIRRAVTGSAWLDHEWSSSYLPQQASGWDWIGINLADGGALMAFRMRDRRGGAFWAGGTHRRTDGMVETHGPTDVLFVPRREWRSPRTGTAYPVSWMVRAGALEITIEPLMDDQEHDTRSSTGAIYWEGAVRAYGGGVEVGRGYLELTGYWRRLSL